MSDEYEYDGQYEGGQQKNQTPHHAIDAERAVLGALIVGYYEIMDSKFIDDDFPLKPGHLYDKRHKLILDLMLRLAEDGNPIDPVIVAQKANQEKNIKRVGGAEYLAELAAIGGAYVNTPAYCALIIEMFQLRMITRYHVNGRADALKPQEISPLQIWDQHQERALELEDKIRGTEKEEISSIGGISKDVVDEVLENIANKNFDKSRGIMSGLNVIDDNLIGIHPGELVVIAAQSGGGKTALAAWCAMAACSPSIQRWDGKEEDFNPPSVLYISAEMTAQKLATRFIAMAGTIDSNFARDGGQKIMDRDSVDSGIAKLTSAASHLKQNPIFICNITAPTTAQIKSVVRRVLRRQRDTPNPLKMVILDYIQLARGGDGQGRNFNREQEISGISKSLLSIAKKNNIAVIALSQVNRGQEFRSKKEPQLDDLRESAAIGHDADAVIMLQRAEEEGVKARVNIFIVKNRSGPAEIKDSAVYNRQTNRFTRSKPAAAATVSVSYTPAATTTAQQQEDEREAAGNPGEEVPF